MLHRLGVGRGLLVVTRAQHRANDEVDLGRLDVEEPVAILLEEVGETARIQQLVEVPPGVGEEREVDDVGHSLGVLARIERCVHFTAE